MPSLALFGAGLVFFTVHYLMLRGFYALEQTRTVFFIQCVIAATNIVVAVLLVGRADAPSRPRRRWCSPTPRRTSSGSAVSYAVLRRGLGGLETPALVRFLVRLVARRALVDRRRRLGGRAALRRARRGPGVLLSLLRGGLAGDWRSTSSLFLLLAPADAARARSPPCSTP